LAHNLFGLHQKIKYKTFSSFFDYQFFNFLSNFLATQATMAPNLKPINLTNESELLKLSAKDVNVNAEDAALTELLDKQADTDGLKSMNADAEDWTDVKHSERKKRDRILDGKSSFLKRYHLLLSIIVDSLCL